LRDVLATDGERTRAGHSPSDAETKKIDVAD